MTEFSPGRDIQAISHVNVVVDDIDVATEFYGTVLGFEQAVNAAGPMDYPGVDLASFARNAGLDDGRISLDIRFLRHPEIGVYLELFTYRQPQGEQTIHRRKTNPPTADGSTAPISASVDTLWRTRSGNFLADLAGDQARTS